MSKWFDPRNKHGSLVGEPRLVACAGVTPPDVAKVLEFLGSAPGSSLPAASTRLLRNLCTMPPAARLARNLKTLLTLLAKQPVRDIMRDGLTEEERYLLLDLEHGGATSQLRAVAQGLLHIQERQQLAQLAQEIFQHERCRCWPVEPNHD